MVQRDSCALSHCLQSTAPSLVKAFLHLALLATSQAEGAARRWVGVVGMAYWFDEKNPMSLSTVFGCCCCWLQEAEHAAAIAAVELLTAERILKPDVPAGSHSRGTATASPSISSATSGVSLPGVGSKRTQSNTDLLEDDSAGGCGAQIMQRAVV